MKTITKSLLGAFFVICVFLVMRTDAQTFTANSAGVTASVAAAQTPAPRKKLVAVCDFDFATVQSSSSAMFGSNIDVGKGISDLLINYLLKDGTYRVIDRENIDKILKEQNFSNSDRANPATAAKIGKILGVDAIIVGKITQFGSDKKTTNVGGLGGGLGRLGVGDVGHSKTKAIVGISAHIIDIDTAEILVPAEGMGESSRESTSLTGGGGGWSGFGGGNVNFGDSNFQQTIIGEAVKLAVTQLSGELVAGAPKLVGRTIVVQGLVAAVDGGQIVLNVGSSTGLKVGDEMHIERVTSEVKDPATGQVIRRMTAPVGVIKITDVDAKSAVGVVISGSGFKTGDVAKTVTQ
jgi:curli biogenesis system outer membrane secretion channel CsgG